MPRNDKCKTATMMGNEYINKLFTLNYSSIDSFQLKHEHNCYDPTKMIIDPISAGSNNDKNNKNSYK